MSVLIPSRKALLGPALTCVALLNGLWILPATTSAPTVAPGSVVINEVAWMGTQADSNDEWIELFNTTDQAIELTGWKLVAADGTPNITLSGIISAHGFFLLERTDDSTVSDILADKIYTGALSNSGESLFLKNPADQVIDSANGNGGSWPAGHSSTRSTMERIDPLTPDSDTNWATNNGIIHNGLDAKGHPINGTPKAQNSTINLPPTADAGPDQVVNEGEAIALDGSGSADPNGDSLVCTWDPGDGSPPLTNCMVSHTYADNGIFIATLVVEDGRGGMSTDTAQIAVNNLPPIVDAGPDQTTTVGHVLHFSGSFTDPGAADTHSIQWDFGDENSMSNTLTTSHSYSAANTYTVTLTVTDDDGGIGSDTLIVTVELLITKGDANADGVIDLRDAILCAEVALELRGVTSIEKEACDVVSPLGSIDGRDVVRIAEIGLGIASTEKLLR